MNTKPVNKIFITVVVLLTIALLAFTGTVLFTHGEAGETVRVEIPRGGGSMEIANILADAGVIQSRTAFVLYAFFQGEIHSLKAGTYIFELPVSIQEVVATVSAGGAATHDVTVFIPEGFTVANIERRLQESGLISEGGTIADMRAGEWSSEFSFLRSVPADTPLEGFLFPDTYRFDPAFNKEEIVSRMLSRFEERTEDIRREAASRGVSFYDIVIMASILEREVPPEDMPRAAGVLTNRLSVGMALQVDATLVYVLGRDIRRSDTQGLDSPFNTYQHRGLPPTPIANPGIAALEAALNPERNDYWYYLSRRSDGSTVFSRTLEEHNAAVQRYLR